MDTNIPLSVPNFSGNEQEYVARAIADEWVSTGGPFITEFEQSVAEFAGADEAVACQSGSAALHLAILESGLERGDIVLAPDLTFIASINPIRYAGGVPVFFDCDDTLCIDVAKLRRFCERECELRDGALFEKSSGARVRAVMPVHIFGNLCDMESIMDIAAEFGLFVIEDACEALGSFYAAGRYAGRHAGTIGDIGALSFNGNKIITTGGGGMLFAQQKKMRDHMRYLSTQAKDDAVRFVHNEVGFNYRLTNLQAALGVAQMEQLPLFIETKKRNYNLYGELGIELLPFRGDISPNYWFYSYMTGGRREQLMEQLAQRGIASRPIWQLMHRLKPYESCRAYEIEKAEFYRDEVLNIPCSTNLSERDVKLVAAAIKDSR